MHTLTDLQLFGLFTGTLMLGILIGAAIAYYTALTDKENSK